MRILLVSHWRIVAGGSWAFDVATIAATAAAAAASAEPFSLLQMML